MVETPGTAKEEGPADGNCSRPIQYVLKLVLTFKALEVLWLSRAVNPINHTYSIANALSTEDTRVHVHTHFRIEQSGNKFRLRH